VQLDFISFFPYFYRKKEMNYLTFREAFIKEICFSTNQVYAWQHDFNKNNLTEWTKKGYLTKLKNGYYSFSELLISPAYSFLIANKMYRPSYISLHTALAFYGLIPEAIVQITSVSALKTNQFKNKLGSFSYKTLQPELMFGYIQKTIELKPSFLIASPEKAILDLLYLYPFYKSSQDIEDLRFDVEIVEEIIDFDKLNEYSKKFRNRQLEKRIILLLNHLGL
jgi:predicted transcriptional regulator of viral defense system